MENIDKFDDLDFYDGFFNEIGEPLYDTRQLDKKIVDNAIENKYDNNIKIFEDGYCEPIFSEINEDWFNVFFESMLI
jgi:hypothetical protein